MWASDSPACHADRITSLRPGWYLLPTCFPLLVPLGEQGTGTVNSPRSADVPGSPVTLTSRKPFTGSDPLDELPPGPRTR